MRGFLVLVLLIVGTASAHLNPANTTANGDFEAGLAGWGSFCGSGICPRIVSPGDASASALELRNSPTGSYVFQDIAASPSLSAITFSAKKIGGGTGVGTSAVSLASNWKTAPLASSIVARIGFAPDANLIYRPGTSQWTSYAPPPDAEWHRYRIEFDAVGSTVAFKVDGIEIASFSGRQLPLGTMTLIIGDGASCDCSGGAAPTVIFDDVHVEADGTVVL